MAMPNAVKKVPLPVIPMPQPPGTRMNRGNPMADDDYPPLVQLTTAQSLLDRCSSCEEAFDTLIESLLALLQETFPSEARHETRGG
jgi:hypothetical protein